MHFGISQDRMSFCMTGRTCEMLLLITIDLLADEQTIAVLMLRSIRECVGDPTPYPNGMWKPSEASGSSTIAERYLEALQTDLREPLGFVFPYIRLLASEFCAELAYAFNLRLLTELHDREHEDKSAIYLRIIELGIIVQAVTGIIRSMNISPSSQPFCFGRIPPLPFEGILEDLKSLQKDYDQTAKYYELEHARVNQDYQIDVNTNQLEEAKESKATAISVGRLAKLAFIYIPLNFVAAVLGMNLAIFGNGTISLWVFSILAAVFVFVSVLPIFGSVTRSFESITEPVIRDTHRACRLAWRSPSRGFWIWIFCLPLSEDAISQ